MGDYQTTRLCVVVHPIGYGLAHNDSRFILVQARMPYVQLVVCCLYYSNPYAQEGERDGELQLNE